MWRNYDQSTVIISDWDLAGWQVLDPNDYVVQFDMHNEKYYAWYDSDGIWIGTAYVVTDHSTLPTAINTTLSRDYPDYTISKVHREFQKDRAAYEVVLKKADDTKMVVLMDSNGTVIKSKIKTP